MKSTKISVIIPVYNVEKYIKTCLNSVINQSLADIEILCVDDCGQDDSMQKLAGFAAKDSRIKIIKHKENKGLARARNTALIEAKGEYIFFLDSDDSIELGILEKLYLKATQDNVDIVISKTNAFLENNSKESSKRLKKTNEYLSFLPFSKYQVSENNFEETLNKISCVAWGRLYKKTFIDEHKLAFINENRTHEDVGFFIKALSCMPKISAIEDIGVLYLLRSDSIISKNAKQKAKKRIDLKANLDDAISYIRLTKASEISVNLIDIIKKHNAKYFTKAGFKVLNIIKFKDFIQINILGVRIVKIYIKNNKKIYNILGLKLKKDISG